MTSTEVRTFDKCPFCGGDIFDAYLRLRDRLNTTAETFDVDECVDCQMAFLNPMPVGDASRYYPPHYLSAQTSSGSRQTTFDFEKWYRYDQYRYDMRLLRRATGIGLDDASSYIDVGCGSGERVTFARQAGCARAVGVDKFNFAKANPTLRAELVNSEILDFVPRDRFQIASMFHVLEHVDDPRRVLAHIRSEILDPGGYLMVQVPNYGSFERRIFGGRWFGLDVPRHLWNFNRAGLVRLLTEVGYRVEAVYQTNAPLHPVTLVPSIFRALDVQRIWVDQRHGDGYKRTMMLLWAGMTVLASPLALLQNLVRRSSMLTVVAASGVGES